MTRTWITAGIAFMLILLGASIFYYKAVVHSYPLLPDQNIDSWYVEFSAVIDPASRNNQGGVELSLVKPLDNAKYAITNTQIFAPKFGIEEVEEAKDAHGSFYRISKRNLKKDETILLRYNVFAISNDSDGYNKDKTNPPIADIYRKRKRLSNPNETTVILYEKIDEIVELAKERSAGDKSYTRQIIKYMNENRADANFLIKEMDAASKEEAIINLLGVEKIRARIANGFALDDRNDDVDIARWIEIYDKKDKAWDRLSTTEAKDSTLNDYYLWWVGARDVIVRDDKLRYNYSLSLKANRDSSLTRQIWLDEKGSKLLKFFSLQTLSFDQQFVVQILLLFPLGALIVSFARQVIGLQTFGTFMPMLIALALRETGLLLGIMFFFGIIFLGLIARAYVTKLHLLMVPRLSVVMTIIVIFIILMMLFSKEQDLSLGISVALFPVVIITMFIERMSTILDEQSPLDAFYGFMGSMLVAMVIYLSLMNDFVMHFTFVFPEMLFVVMALCLMLGRYNGYKLLEYWRFRKIRSQLHSQGDS